MRLRPASRVLENSSARVRRSLGRTSITARKLNEQGGAARSTDIPLCMGQVIFLSATSAEAAMNAAE
jgi:hypothetical protein